MIPKAPNKSQLEEVRLRREYEKSMQNIVKEVLFYFFFLILISFIAWIPKDDTVYFMNQNIRKIMEGDKISEAASTVSSVK